METVPHASRQFGQWRVTLHNRIIDVVGDWYSNRGLIYGHMIDKWDRDPLHTQVIGMDSERGITKQVLAYIHRYIRKNSESLRI